MTRLPLACFGSSVPLTLIVRHQYVVLTALGRADIFPSGDRALQLAAQHLFGLPETPSAAELTALAAAWNPWRAVAARLLWSHYRGLRGLPQAVE